MAAAIDYYGLEHKSSHWLTRPLKYRITSNQTLNTTKKVNIKLKSFTIYINFNKIACYLSSWKCYRTKSNPKTRSCTCASWTLLFTCNLIELGINWWISLMLTTMWKQLTISSLLDIQYLFFNFYSHLIAKARHFHDNETEKDSFLK